MSDKNNDSYNLIELMNNASQSVRKIVYELVNSDDDIDRDNKLRILDSIETNVDGKYSADDMKYAQIVREMFSAETAPIDMSKLGTKNIVLNEKNAKILRDIINS